MYLSPFHIAIVFVASLVLVLPLSLVQALGHGTEDGTLGEPLPYSRM